MVDTVNPEFDAKEAVTNYNPALAVPPQPGAMRATLAATAPLDPDEQAQAKRIADKTGVPIASVLGREKEISQRHDFNNFDFDGYTSLFPASSQMLSGQTFASVAHDDLENLGYIESTLRTLRDGGSAYRVGLKYDIGSSIYGRLSEITGSTRDALNRMDWKNGSFFNTFGNPLDRATEFFRGKSSENEDEANQILAPMMQNANDVQRGYYSAMRSFGAMTPGLAASLVTANPQFALGNAGVVAGGGVQENLDAHLTPTQALGRSLIDGTIEIGTEVVPIVRFLGDLKAGTPLLRTLAHQAVAEVPGELIATTLQTFNQWAQLNPDLPFQTYLDQLPGALKDTAIASIIGVGVQTGSLTIANRAMQKMSTLQVRSETAEMNAQALEKLQQMAAASKVLERSQDSFKQFIQTANENSPVSDVYIDVAELAQSGIDINALAEVSPSVALQAPTALESGGLLKIPVSEFATHVATTDLGQPLIDVLRTDPLAMSRREAQEFMQTSASQFEAELENEMTESTDRRAFDTSRQVVFDNLYEQLEDAGRFNSDVNRQYATMLSNFYSVMGVRTQQTPEEMFSKFPVAIQAESAGPNSIVLDQLAGTEAARIYDMPGFYSKMHQHISEKFNNTGTVAQFKKQVEAAIANGNFKQDEYTWSNLDKFFPLYDDQNTKISKQDLLDFIAKERLALRETVYSKVPERVKVQLKRKSDSGFNFDDYPTVDDVEWTDAEQMDADPDEVEYQLEEFYIDNHKSEYDPETWFKEHNNDGNLVDATALDEEDEPTEESTFEWNNDRLRDYFLDSAYEAARESAGYEMKASVAGYTYEARFYPEQDYFNISVTEPNGRTRQLTQETGRANEENVRSVIVGDMFEQGIIFDEDYIYELEQEFLEEQERQRQEREELSDLEGITEEQAIDFLQKGDKAVRVVSEFENQPFYTEYDIPYLQQFLAQGTFGDRKIVAFDAKDIPLTVDAVTVVDAAKKGYKAFIVYDQDISEKDGYGGSERDAGERVELTERNAELLVDSAPMRNAIRDGVAHYVILPKHAEIEGVDFRYENRWTGRLNYESYQSGGPKGPQHEVVFTVPYISDKNVRQHNWQGASNVLMHMRFNDRTDVEGKKTLFIEEFQSDWHQQGSEKGYQSKTVEYKAPELNDVSEREYDWSYVDQGREFTVGKGVVPGRQEAVDYLKNYIEKINQETAQEERLKIPPAPFSALNKYNELMMKRMIVWAAQNGYDRVAWTTGEQQASRWSGLLQREVSRIDVVGVTEDTVSISVYTPGQQNVSKFLADNVKGSIPAQTADGTEYVTVPRKEASTIFGKSVTDSIDEAGPGGIIEGQNLKINSKGMVEVYDKVLPNIANGLIKKFGSKVSVTKIDTGQGEPTHQWSFDVTPQMKESIEQVGFPLFQGEEVRRGSFNPQTSTITLLNAADLSTFLHEAGHFFLETLNKLAIDPNSPAQIREDMETAIKWMGYKDLADWNLLTLDQQREGHEKFARGFEAYLFTGKAPNLELRNVFRRFRDWLVSIYKDLVNLRAPLNDEIRGVFDRLVATDEMIREAEVVNRMAPMFLNAEDATMTQDEFVAYQQLGAEATGEAKDELQARAMRDMKWLSNARSKVLKDLQQKAEAKRKAILREVRDEVMNEPVNLARNFISRGKFEIPEDASKAMRRFFTEAAADASKTKLSLPILKEMYGEEPNAIWRFMPTGQYGYVANDGLHPDLVAEQFGFSSGDQLVRQLLEAENPKDKIKAMTDQRMLERYGDLNDQESLERAVDEAVHNEVRARFVATEMNALRKATGQRRVLAVAAKQFAETLIGRLRVRDVKPSRYTAAEARAARLADEARRGGDLEAAAMQKRNQLVQLEAARAANNALEDIDAGVRYLNKFNKEGVRKKVDVKYLDQIDALLERFDLRRGQSLKAIDKRTSLAEWLKSQEEQGLEPDIPESIAKEAYRQHYKDMSVENFRGLVDSVKQIEHLGRLTTKLLTAQGNRDFNATVERLVVSIDENKGTRQADNTTRATMGDRATRLFKGYIAQHRKVASLSRVMDGVKDGGPMWEVFIRSMNKAGDKEASMREKATERLMELVAPVMQQGQMGGKGVYFPSVERSLNREERIGLLLNMGNAGNIQRLLDGEGWTREQVQPIIDSMTQEELNFAQAVWDYFETFRPEIAAKERRVYGKEPNWIEPQPLMTRFGELRGGYYPIKYDTRRNAEAEEHDLAEFAKMQMRGAYTSATTRRSFTKARADKVEGRPLLLTMDALYAGVNEVIHDLSWHEWLIDMNRLLRSKRLDRAIREPYGAETVQQFKTALKDIAAGEMPGGAFEKAMGNLRAGASVAGLGLNIVSSIINFSGISQSFVRVGPRWVMMGVDKFASGPKALIEEIYGKSEFMRLRGKTMMRELNEVQSMVRDKSKARAIIDSISYAPMTMTQVAIDAPTWWGAYQKALAEGNEDARATELADQAVLDAQGGGQVKDLAAIQRGGPVLKLFTTFYSYFSTTLQLTVEQTAKTNFKDPNEVIRLAGDYFMLYVIPAAFGVIIHGLVGGDDDWKSPEKLAKSYINEQMSFAMGTLVGVREASAAVQKAFGVNKYNLAYGGPAGLRFFNELDKLGTQIGQGELDAALRRSLVNVLGVTLRLPSSQANKTIDGIVALMDGDTNNPAAVVIGAPRN